MENPHAIAGAGVGKSNEPDSADPNAKAPKTQTRQARWQAENPLARWAHVAFASALKRGLVQREPCEVCGAEPADAHHSDYSRPLAVTYLCRRHHKAVHAKGDAK
jgi:hypothetical protein